MTFKILNLEPEDYSQEALQFLEEVAQVDDGPLSRADLKNSIAGYDAIITRLGHRIDQDILENATSLKAIVTATTGLNHIDVSKAEAQGVAVLSLRGEQEFLKAITATAEHTMGLLLALTRHIPASCADVLEGHWDRDQFKGQDLAGRTIGIIGYGRLGQIIAGYAAAFGMRVLTHDIKDFAATDNVEFVSMDKLFAEADIVSLHVLYTPDTHHLINADCFKAMKKGALFINTSRGEIVDEYALLQALEAGVLAGAALDVLSGENSGTDGWMKDCALVQYASTHKNLLITPHIGGATYCSMAKTEMFMAQKLRHFIEGLKI